MSFLDKLLGRDKTATGDTEQNSVKSEGMHEEQKDSEQPSGTPPSEDIDPQFIKDTEGNRGTYNTSLPRKSLTTAPRLRAAVPLPSPSSLRPRAQRLGGSAKAVGRWPMDNRPSADSKREVDHEHQDDQCQDQPGQELAPVCLGQRPSPASGEEITV